MACRIPQAVAVVSHSVGLGPPSVVVSHLSQLGHRSVTRLEYGVMSFLLPMSIMAYPRLPARRAGKFHTGKPVTRLVENRSATTAPFESDRRRPPGSWLLLRPPTALASRGAVRALPPTTSCSVTVL